MKGKQESLEFLLGFCSFPISGPLSQPAEVGMPENQMVQEPYKPTIC